MDLSSTTLSPCVLGYMIDEVHRYSLSDGLRHKHQVFWQSSNAVSTRLREYIAELLFCPIYSDMRHQNRYPQLVRSPGGTSKGILDSKTDRLFPRLGSRHQ